MCRWVGAGVCVCVRERESACVGGWVYVCVYQEENNWTREMGMLMSQKW